MRVFTQGSGAWQPPPRGNFDYLVGEGAMGALVRLQGAHAGLRHRLFPASSLLAQGAGEGPAYVGGMDFDSF